MIYADFSYYKEHYKGVQIKSAEGFEPAVRRASEYADYITLGRAQDYAEKERVKDAVCAMAEKYHLISLAAEAAAGDGVIESETVGPHTIRYASPTEAAKAAQQEIYSIARRYLWPYMYRGVPMI